MKIFEHGICVIGKNSMFILTAIECKMVASFIAGVFCGMIFISL